MCADGWRLVPELRVPPAARLADKTRAIDNAPTRPPSLNAVARQDENVLPKQFQTALERVRAGADVMPRKQLEQVSGEVGWRGQHLHVARSGVPASSCAC